MEPVVPQGVWGTYTPRTPRVNPPGSLGLEAGKYQSCYVQEVPKEESRSSGRPDSHKLGEANQGTAQDHAGQKSPRPSGRGRQPQRPTPRRGKKTPLNPGRKGIRGGVAKTRKNPQQECPGWGSSQGRSVPEWEPSDRTRRLTSLKELRGRKQARVVISKNRGFMEQEPK